MHVLPWCVRPRRLRLQGQRSATDDDELHLVNVQAMKSSMKSQETYTAMLLCDSETVVDTHCSCGPSGARAFPCSHTAAMMVEISGLQGEPSSKRMSRSMREFERAVASPNVSKHE